MKCHKLPNWVLGQSLSLQWFHCNWGVKTWQAMSSKLDFYYVFAVPMWRQKYSQQSFWWSHGAGTQCQSPEQAEWRSIPSDDARVFAARGKRLCCHPHPHNQISNWYSYGYNDAISVDCEQYAKFGCDYVIQWSSEFHIFASPNAAPCRVPPGVDVPFAPPLPAATVYTTLTHNNHCRKSSVWLSRYHRRLKDHTRTAEQADCMQPRNQQWNMAIISGTTFTVVRPTLKHGHCIRTSTEQNKKSICISYWFQQIMLAHTLLYCRHVACTALPKLANSRLGCFFFSLVCELEGNRVMGLHYDTAQWPPSRKIWEGLTVVVPYFAGTSFQQETG